MWLQLQVAPISVLLCLVLSFSDVGNAKLARGESGSSIHPASNPGKDGSERLVAYRCEHLKVQKSVICSPEDRPVLGCRTEDSADFIHPCNATTRECLVKSTQEAIPPFVKGIPSLGVPSLDPFVIEKLSIPLSGLKVTFYQGKVTGFRTCIVDNVISELEKRHFVLEFHCNLTIKGQYDAVGRILLFPINGEGDAKIKLTNLRMKVDINTKYTKDDQGVDHFGLRNYKYSFSYGDKVVFDLKNLFKESKELSNTVLNFLNENWKTVAEEFGKPIVDYAVDLAIRTIEKFFIAVPYSELINVPLPR